MNKTKPFRLGLVTCLWGRPVLTSLCLNYYALMFRYTDLPLEILPVAVASEEDPYLKQFLTFGWEVILSPNDPLSDKFNNGVEHFKDKDVDALLIIGSDDLVSPLYFYNIPDLLKKADRIGFKDLYVLDQLENKIYFLEGCRPGAGRVLNKNILEALDYRVWPDGLNKRLDAGQDQLIEDAMGIRREFQVKGGACVLDIKGKEEDNIWALERLLTRHEELGREYREVGPKELREYFKVTIDHFLFPTLYPPYIIEV